MPFIVCARRWISSSVSGSGTRRCRSSLVMPATSARIASTGESARPTKNHVTPATSETMSGTPTTKMRRSAAVLSSTGSRLVATYSV